ncbi:hypothetical protein [Pseudobacteroides cellulosolvens]|uniref:Uncharacterized protein n=1 Tax=Pseudobacteroides cellulosolvens ATCC 35603 = DSM 2933 TaxID=398512 RepID=A0A0L6JUJ0_9FIRM|nr:hypothetical protein [Pseudobacteroides cellulosolvens]KNY29488.1 hypothetical protein Bccel_4762 [Pseudobacteroides cellulosolvens ATCC 35603 = DSM 2933]
MRKESRVMKQCTLLYKGLNIDRLAVLHKTKLLLEIYRPVVWSTQNRLNEVCETTACYWSKNLEHALDYLENFAPEIERDKFNQKVHSLFETHWLISMIDSAMSKIYEYPDNGKLYHEILVKQYMTVIKYSEQEMLELLNMERSTYYDKKREAIDLFAICLWGYTIPTLKGIIVGQEGEGIPSFFYQSVDPD